MPGGLVRFFPLRFPVPDCNGNGDGDGDGDGDGNAGDGNAGDDDEGAFPEKGMATVSLPTGPLLLADADLEVAADATTADADGDADDDADDDDDAADDDADGDDDDEDEVDEVAARSVEAVSLSFLMRSPASTLRQDLHRVSRPVADERLTKNFSTDLI
jgi:hypothetical protein